ncbi:MAG: cyclase [Gemmatales bacterium]|nr:MAG: cyclase [Gemmatales bacterium]
MKGKMIGGLALVSAFLLGWIAGNNSEPVAKGTSADSQAKAKPRTLKKWKPGKGWGWVWGKDDEVGSLNEMTPESVRDAIRLVKEGKVYDLGVNYDRESYKWPGHSPAEIILFRGPEGVKRQGDFTPAVDPKINPRKMAWHSCALFINDNVATQIDGLGHVTEGDDNHWYNGFTEEKWGGNFGIRKCDATTIPPIITRGVLIDVAGLRGVDALPPHYQITVGDLKAALEKQKTDIQPGDTVLIRTGTLRYWGKNGSDHKKIAEHDSAGLNLEAARWLVEQKGAILLASDTSGLEYSPGPMEKPAFIPVHRYLLIEQGVHIGEFHNLEELARDQTYEFCYICLTNKIRGSTAGFTLRPIAIK